MYRLLPKSFASIFCIICPIVTIYKFNYVMDTNPIIGSC